MSAEVTVGVIGWALAAVALPRALLSSRALSSRMESVARACHELRGPLTAARLGIALVTRSGELSGAALRGIDLELSRAALALDDLGATGGRRSAEAPLSWEPVDTLSLLADCGAAAQPGARAVGVALEVRWSGAERYAWGDRVRLAQALRNLIGNAIEHGAGDVAVRGRGAAGSIRIEVTDAGPGLPAPLLQLVRRPRRGRGARGRGLAIAAAIAERHGGRLSTAPSDGGARLVLELPAAVEHVPAQPLGLDEEAEGVGERARRDLDPAAPDCGQRGPAED